MNEMQSDRLVQSLVNCLPEAHGVDEVSRQFALIVQWRDACQAYSHGCASPMEVLSCVGDVVARQELLRFVSRLDMPVDDQSSCFPFA